MPPSAPPIRHPASRPSHYSRHYAPNSASAGDLVPARLFSPLHPTLPRTAMRRPCVHFSSSPPWPSDGVGMHEELLNNYRAHLEGVLLSDFTGSLFSLRSRPLPLQPFPKVRKALSFVNLIAPACVLWRPLRNMALQAIAMAIHVHTRRVSPQLSGRARSRYAVVLAASHAAAKKPNVPKSHFLQMAGYQVICVATLLRTAIDAIIFHNLLCTTHQLCTDATESTKPVQHSPTSFYGARLLGYHLSTPDRSTGRIDCTFCLLTCSILTSRGI
ncbi:hypothetical protein B0I35DRAFT_215888 [Stachybotrys elegans]|uniref:Uncharacterized protein n=1 Tax=Stachybotrys elegans TaxID=80388 RepID=A0A8K0SPW2_9HYPO|nr:hypothetical protein B0I35DRAFT_215888 [Stachybotrys elegans]